MNTFQTWQLLLDKGLLSESDSVTFIDGHEARSISISLDHPLVISSLSHEEQQIFGKRLLCVYEKDSPILCISTDGNILTLTIEEFNTYDIGNMICFFDQGKAHIRPVTPFSLSSIEKTVERLLAPGGCPWDRAQDHLTLRTYFLQEVYEVIDAIDKNDMVNLEEELGDVLLQVIFHAALAEREGYFSMQDVVDGITHKMVRRHPFVFGHMTMEETKEALGDWEKRKRLEKNRKYLLSGVSRYLPSQLLACIIQRKVGSNGRENIFFREDIQEDIRKLISSILSKGTTQDKEFLAGAFLFAIDRVFGEAGVEPELALHRFSLQFMDQFQAFERELLRAGKNLMDLTPEETRYEWQKFSETH